MVLCTIQRHMHTICNSNTSLETTCSTHTYTHKLVHRTVDTTTQKHTRLFEHLSVFYSILRILFRFFIIIIHHIFQASFCFCFLSMQSLLRLHLTCYISWSVEGHNIILQKYDPVGDTANGFIPMGIGKNNILTDNPSSLVPT